MAKVKAKQSKIKMLTEKQRKDPVKQQEVVSEFFKNNGILTKQAFCDKVGISPRTLGRWIDKFSEKVTRNATVSVGKKSDKQKEANVSIFNFIITKSSVSVTKDGETRTVPSANTSFKDVIDACIHGNMEQAWLMSDTRKLIESFSQGKITIDPKSNKVMYGTFVVRDKMTEKMIEMLKEGQDGLKAFVNFYEQLMQVDDKDIVEQLWPFIEHNSIRLNDDGTFTGYRAVTHDFLDKHTRTINNAVGETPVVPRSEVNKDPNVSCAKGLHVGSLDYAKGFRCGNDRLIEVNCHVQDVVSVPYDYSGGKLRCCRFEVIREVK